jgi:hypothetical protein
LKEDGIHLKEKWDDESNLILAWPQGTIYFADGSIAAKDREALKFLGDTCIPFSDGKRVLLGGEGEGLFLIEAEKTTVIFPDKQYIDEYTAEDETDSAMEKDTSAHGAILENTYGMIFWALIFKPWI